MFTSCCFCCEDSRGMAPRVRENEDGDSDIVRCADLCCGSGMSEGRQSQVVLLDDYRLDILIKPKLYSGELLDMVASHFNLKEKEYFGISYIDDTGHQNWLQLDRRVLEHDFPKKSSQSTLVLFFRIKYFVESITQLRDNATVEAFYLQAQALVYQGVFEVTCCQAFTLAALVLQAAYGDYVDDETAKEHLKKLPIIPTSTLLEHPSLLICEKRIIEEYKTFTGLARGNAIVSYMQTVESLPTYGVHYYEVKDKAGLPWWLGISYKGICQYDLTDKKVPRKVFLWKQLENLYFRDRKFSIEVHDPKSRPTTSRKTFGAGNICVHVWFAINPSLTKCIWSMAISQHQFYLDRKHKTMQPILRNLSDIATELTRDASRSNASTNSTTLSRSGSTHSLPALKINGDISLDLKAETVEMLVTLKARREALEEAMHKKCEELKKLCLQEGELTGMIPPEMPLSPGEQIPITRKRNSSDFSLKERLSWKKKTKEEKELAELELEYEIQNKITTACGKLASDPSIKKTVRRQRKMSFQKAQSKLKELENKMHTFKRKVEKIKKAQLHQFTDDEHRKEILSQSAEELDQKGMSTSSHSITSQDSKASACNSTSSSPLTSTLHSPSSSSAPSSPMKTRNEKIVYHKSQSGPGCGGLPPPNGQGYTPNSVYQTRTSYRSQQYPTLPTRLPNSVSAGAVLEYCMKRSNGENKPKSRVVNLVTPYQNKFESTLDIDGSNLYSVPTQRTSQAFDTQDDILASLPNSQQDLGLISRHNSLDRRKRHSIRKQSYLENKRASMVASIQSPSSDCEQLLYSSGQTIASPTYETHHPHYFHHNRYISGQLTKDDKEHNYFSHTFSEGLSHYAQSVPESSRDGISQSYSHHEELCQRPNKLGSQLSTRPNYDLKLYPYMENPVHSSLSPSSTEDDRCYLIPKMRDSGVCNAGLEVLGSQADPFQNAASKFSSLSINSPCSTISRTSSRLSSNLPSPQVASNASNVEISVVRYGQYQAYWEETKPYEISDFYKYSKKHRKQCNSEAIQTPNQQSFPNVPMDFTNSENLRAGFMSTSCKTREQDLSFPKCPNPSNVSFSASPVPSNSSMEPMPERKPEKCVKKVTLV